MAQSIKCQKSRYGIMTGILTFYTLYNIEGLHPPGAYFSRAGKVGKRALRGSTPKNPGIWRSGRGGYCFTHRIDSKQELPPQALSLIRLTACENWEAKTSE